MVGSAVEGCCSKCARVRPQNNKLKRKKKRKRVIFYMLGVHFLRLKTYSHKVALLKSLHTQLFALFLYLFLTIVATLMTFISLTASFLMHTFQSFLHSLLISIKLSQWWTNETYLVVIHNLLRLYCSLQGFFLLLNHNHISLLLLQDYFLL